jgi:hypothetical protein
MCCGRLEAVHVSQTWDLIATTFIMPTPDEKGHAGGGVEFLTRMMPVPLAKIPATQVVPQDVRTRHANITTAFRNVFRMLRGRHRMGLLQTALRNHARMQILPETHIVGLGIVTVNEPLPSTKGDAVNLSRRHRRQKPQCAEARIPHIYPVAILRWSSIDPAFADRWDRVSEELRERRRAAVVSPTRPNSPTRRRSCGRRFGRVKTQC